MVKTNNNNTATSINVHESELIITEDIVPTNRFKMFRDGIKMTLVHNFIFIEL